jgi:hypothetical protein
VSGFDIQKLKLGGKPRERGQSTAVSFTTPAATDNYTPAPTVVCSPSSGSMLPAGTTTVTCTATDASGNTAQCTFPVNAWTFCLQDDSNPGNVVFVNAFTGDFFFCCDGVPIASGRGDAKHQRLHWQH